MRTTLLSLHFASLFVLGPVALARADEAAEIVKREGRCAFTDSHNFYVFDKDGTFESGPLGKSGRTIIGTWTPDGSNHFVVEGLWGWMNGLSPTHDRRRMTVYFSPHDVKPNPRGTGPHFYTRKEGITKVYDGYFIVDELVKLTPPSKKEVPAKPR